MNVFCLAHTIVLVRRAAPDQKSNYVFRNLSGFANGDDKGTTGGEKQVRFQEVKSRETDTKTGKRRYLFDKRRKKKGGLVRH